MYNPDYYDELASLLGYDDGDMIELLHGEDSAIDEHMIKFQTTIYDYYRDSLCSSEVPDPEKNPPPVEKDYCAFSNLTYSQWLTGAVLIDPLP